MRMRSGEKSFNTCSSALAKSPTKEQQIQPVVQALEKKPSKFQLKEGQEQAVQTVVRAAKKVKTGGKQYKVSEGDVIFVEKLEANEGDVVTLNEVLACSKDGNLVVGSPVVEGASVQAKVVEQGKGKKIIVFKYKAKKDYRRKNGHRQAYTKLVVEKINA